MTHPVALILARAADGTIGNDGGLPWHLPADLRRFKALTMGRPMIMGRRTFVSLPGPLPGRRHIVLTRNAGWTAEGAEPVASAEAALETAGGPASVIGGAEIFRLFLPHADRIELTEIHRAYAGDTRVPYPGAEWIETARAEHDAQADRPAYAFVTLVHGDGMRR